MKMVETETEILTRAQGKRDLPRVLLVEDEKEIRDIIVPWLFADGFDCREAADGWEGIELLKDGLRINLILSNLLLPKVDGYTFLQHVKRHHPRIPFAYVTAINDPEIRETVIREGADGYLLKPFTQKEFLTMVRRLVGRGWVR